MSQSDEVSKGRRSFLLQAAATGAGAAAAAATAAAAQAPTPPQGAASPGASPSASPSVSEVRSEGRPGSDYMVDVLKSLGFEYICANPGSSFRGLHESIINYGGNSRPELITCMHEESSVAMAHGYFKAEGTPLPVMAHGTVGIQHASMAVYNAWCDRVPVYLILGNTLDATMRQPGVEWVHSVQDAAALVRDFTKWDDSPVSLQHFGESAVRAYKMAMTPPSGPVVIVADTELQEQPIHSDRTLVIPKLTPPSPPQAESGAVTELARLLVEAEQPLFIADRLARTPAGLERLVELAELLQAGVVSTIPNLMPPVGAGRMNFPTRHPLNQTYRSNAAIAAADVIVGLEISNFFGATNIFIDQVERTTRPAIRPDAKLITLNSTDLIQKANYQDFQRYAAVNMALTGDGEATLPSLIEAVRRLLTDQRKSTFERRGKALAEASAAARERFRGDAALAWDASPITTARLAAEIWEQIRKEDWSLVSGGLSGWPVRLWDFTKHYQHLGVSGGSGIGYGAPAAIGAALANRKHGRLSVNIQNDGDLMYAPGVLWTAAHHRIPVLTIMNNNRAYHEEMMHVQRMSNRRNRGVDRAHIGNEIDNPGIDYAKLAQSMGWYAEGPISNPRDIGPALKRAIAVVKRGEPAMVDVMVQPR
jgi:thiamine pyrophosphate-dependent acetolactate synthase large subunit-like protein